MSRRALEQPVLRSLLPPLAGPHVLDIGGGCGAFAAYCLEADVPRYRGVDISARMIARAHHDLRDPRASLEPTAAEDLDLADYGYDRIVSSLGLHYGRDIQAVFAHLAGPLHPSGRLARPVEHPICTALLQNGFESEPSDRPHGPSIAIRRKAFATRPGASTG
ncbi:methyltransferase domain-containing protein [Salinisphaera sp. SPP-AMP-43]|uniref:class I SAM-dependent methyltransferase n=1 Tax=Salinisphaera sp. SPP-AMP-43 TaxID=3121288 RepID=UPI003C6E98BC